MSTRESALQLLAVSAFLVVAIASPVASASYVAPPGAPRPALTPPAVPPLILNYTFSSAKYVQPYYPEDVFWTDLTTAVVTYQFSVPGGSSGIVVSALPPGWILEDAGPGAIVDNGVDLYFPSFNATETQGGDLFTVQLLAPLPVDPEYAALAGEVASIIGSISAENVSIQARVIGTQKLISVGLQEENATYGYHLVPGKATRLGLIDHIPIFVELLNGGTANVSVAAQVATGLTVAFDYSNGTSTTPTWSTSEPGPGSFELALNLTAQQAEQVQNGSSLVTLTSPVSEGTFTNLAGGVIAGSLIENATSAPGWWSEVFGISTPPPSSDPQTVQEYIADLAWFGDSAAGRALTALVSILAVLTYVTAAHRATKERVRARLEREQASGGAA